MNIIHIIFTVTGSDMLLRKTIATGLPPMAAMKRFAEQEGVESVDLERCITLNPSDIYSVEDAEVVA